MQVQNLISTCFDVVYRAACAQNRGKPLCKTTSKYTVIHTRMYIWFSSHKIVCCQTGSNETYNCMMISVKAFCAVPFNCAVDHQ